MWKGVEQDQLRRKEGVAVIVEPRGKSFLEKAAPFQASPMKAGHAVRIQHMGLIGHLSGFRSIGVRKCPGGDITNGKTEGTDENLRCGVNQSLERGLYSGVSCHKLEGPC